MLGQRQLFLSSIALVLFTFFSSSLQYETEDSDGEDAHGHGKLNSRWQINLRNTIGSRGISLANGPAVVVLDGNYFTVSAPPFGNGSINLLAGPPPQKEIPPDLQEKAGFRNEVDYYAQLFQTISKVGFYVFNARKDSHAPRVPSNPPTIEFEVWFHLPNEQTPVYTLIVWQPPSSVPVNQWSDFIDATKVGTWWLTNDDVIKSGCGPKPDSQCSFGELKKKTNSTDWQAYIESVGISKGPIAYDWQGAVDGLRINDKIMDFEAEGVYEISLRN
ncbi:hypothetical protein Unana1_04127 [Umbelopsis nana]